MADSITRLPPAPGVVVSSSVLPRRVYVRDPSGRSLLRGEGLLTGECRMGETVWSCAIAFASGVTATVPPTWVSELPECPNSHFLMPDALIRSQ